MQIHPNLADRHNMSYDQVVQARAAMKMLGQIDGQANVSVSDAEIMTYAATMSLNLDDMDSEELRGELITQKCAEIYRKMFGQRSTRHHEEWRNVIYEMAG